MSEAEISINPIKAIELLGSVGSPLIVISELIKNSFDASPNNIEISYDTINNSITVFDDGEGFADEDISMLNQLGSSRKKVSELYAHNSHMYTGSKGLGLLSVFTLCEELVITTRNDNQCYEILWNKSQATFSYNTVDSALLKKGSLITLSGIDPVEMNFLVSDIEINKLKHISTYIYKNQYFTFPNISLRLDGGPLQNLLFNTAIDNMLYDIFFIYNSKSSTLILQINIENDSIENKALSIQDFDITNINYLLKENFGIDSVIKSRFNSTYPSIESLNDVPDFEGRFVIYRGKRNNTSIYKYGSGVNIYVNDFALYNYLDDSNDWLELANFSQTRKSTTLKPHNVYGYVNLPNFNENRSNLKISNERAGFIMDSQYHQLMYLLKGVILHMLFNIDLKIKSQMTEIKGKKVPDKPKEEMDAPSPSYRGIQSPEKHGTGKQQQESNSHEHEQNKTQRITPRRNLTTNFLKFTDDHLKLIQTAIPIDENYLNSKIIEIIHELNLLNIKYYRYAVISLYRNLLESTILFYKREAGDQNLVEITNLPGDIQSIINSIHKNAADRKNKRIKDHAIHWKKYTKTESLILVLNSYIHRDTPIDSEFIIRSWNQMRNFIVFCLTGQL
jgi:hypothetical protein